MRRFWNFLSDQRGNTAIIFGLSIVPLLALGGGAVDFAQRGRIHAALQSACDTAALAAAREIQNGEMQRDDDWDTLVATARANAQNFITASLQNIGGVGTPDLTIDITNSDVTISSSYDMKTSFLGVIGINALPAKSLSSVAIPPAVLVEISMVLDYSGSMVNNDKYIRMRSAATDFINKVAQNRGDRTKIGIVPFSKYVYASLPGAMIRGTSAGQATTMMDACLSNRGYPYSTGNETPYSTISDSRWPETTGADCDLYADHGLKVRDLTDDFSSLTSAIAAMQPANLTNISLATEMGWHMLSPNAPFETARDYSDPDLRKILILLTDGMQTVAAEGPSGSTSVSDANDTTAELCTNIKDSGVTLYTIAYDVDDTSVYSLLSGCASGPSQYHEVHDASGIDDVFETIYQQIAESSWLSK